MISRRSAKLSSLARRCIVCNRRRVPRNQRVCGACEARDRIDELVTPGDLAEEDEERTEALAYQARGGGATDGVCVGTGFKSSWRAKKDHGDKVAEVMRNSEQVLVDTVQNSMLPRGKHTAVCDHARMLLQGYVEKLYSQPRRCMRRPHIKIVGLVYLAAMNLRTGHPLTEFIELTDAGWLIEGTKKNGATEKDDVERAKRVMSHLVAMHKVAPEIDMTRYSVAVPPMVWRLCKQIGAGPEARARCEEVARFISAKLDLDYLQKSTDQRRRPESVAGACYYFIYQLSVTDSARRAVFKRRLAHYCCVPLTRISHAFIEGELGKMRWPQALTPAELGDKPPAAR